MDINERKRLIKEYRLLNCAIKHANIAVEHMQKQHTKLLELNDIIADYPIVLEKYNECATQQNELVHKFNETGDIKFLRKAKRLSKTIPSFDEEDKVKDKQLKKVYHRLIQLHADTKKEQGVY